MTKGNIVDLRPGAKPAVQTPAQVNQTDLPPIRDIDFLAQVDERIGKLIRPLFRNPSCAPLGEYRELVDLGREAMADPDVLAVRDVLSKDAPATVREIKMHVALLIGSFTRDAANPAIYPKMLAEDIGSLCPTRLELEMACASIRRTKTFIPAIAEVMEAVRAARKTVSDWHRRMEIIFDMQIERGEKFLLRREQLEKREELNRQSVEKRKADLLEAARNSKDVWTEDQDGELNE